MTIPQSLFDMRGRRVLITGGGTGLGQRFAHTLAAAGASVILAARRADKLEQTASSIRAAGGKLQEFAPLHHAAVSMALTFSASLKERSAIRAT